MKGPVSAPPVEVQFAQKLAANDKKDRYAAASVISIFIIFLLPEIVSTFFVQRQGSEEVEEMVEEMRRYSDIQTPVA